MVPLPSASRGAYSARLHLGTNDYGYSFQVQDFQPNAFEMALQAPASFAAGEAIAVPLSARYLFGKALCQRPKLSGRSRRKNGVQARGFHRLQLPAHRF